MVPCIIKSTSITEANNYIHITYTIWGDRGVLPFRKLLARSARSVRIQIWVKLVLDGWEEQRKVVVEPEARRGDREMRVS